MSTVFKPVGWSVQGLFDSVESGVTQLPDLQWPFVWPKSKIRDLLYSMYRGSPVGELMFWNVSQEESSRTISGATERIGAHQITDGQNRAKLGDAYNALKAKFRQVENQEDEQVAIQGLMSRVSP